MTALPVHPPVEACPNTFVTHAREQPSRRASAALVSPDSASKTALNSLALLTLDEAVRVRFEGAVVFWLTLLPGLALVGLPCCLA
jgi:hypothetical protein